MLYKLPKINFEDNRQLTVIVIGIVIVVVVVLVIVYKVLRLLDKHKEEKCCYRGQNKSPKSNGRC